MGGSGHDPAHSRTFHAILEDTPTGPFDDTGGIGDLRESLGQVVPACFPERVLAAHEQGDVLVARGVALSDLFGHPTENRLNLRLGRVHVIALQGRPDRLEAGCRA